jgi:hypothetical protein
MLKSNRDQNSWLNLSFNTYSQLKINILHGHSYGKKETSQSDFSIGYGAQLAYQAIPKILDEELSPSVV